MKRDYSYFQEGVVDVPTTSSQLVSSSRFLNHPGLRDWVVLHLLRRNGPDMPVPSDPTRGLAQALNDLRTPERMQALIDAEKARNEPFRIWLEERWLSPLVSEDFAKYPEGSFGGAFHRYVTSQGFAYNFGWKNAEPANDWHFIQMRNGQIHDFEHLMSGGAFNAFGELLPYMVRLSNPFTHLTPEVATEFSLIYLFGGNRMIFRSFLHYPDTWLTALDIMERGIRIGRASEPIMMMRYEDALPLSIPEAREMLGWRGAEDLDTEEASRIFTEQQRQPSLLDPVQPAAE